MNLETISIIVASVLGGSGVAGLVSAFISRRKISAESGAIEVRAHLEIVDAANSLVGSFQAEIKRLHEEIEKLVSDVDVLREENREQNSHIQKLEGDLIDLRRENSKLRARCSALEAENIKLKQGK